MEIRASAQGANTSSTPSEADYAFQWGDALFVMLDPFWFSDQGVKKSKDPWAVRLSQPQGYYRLQLDP